MGKRFTFHRLGRHNGSVNLEASRGVWDIGKKSKIERRIVTDWGQIPNQPANGDENPMDASGTSFFDDGIKIDAVRITHAHYDHIGLLPALAPFLKPNARVFVTRPTAAMLEHIFTDSLKINELKGKQLPFTEDQFFEIMNRLAVIDHPGEIEILPGIIDYVHPEGHIKGACSFTTKISKRLVHYSGDRCSHNQPSVNGAKLLPKKWWPDIIAGSDCTSGADPDSNLRNRQSEMDKAIKLGMKIVRSGAPAFYPAFSIGRGGDIAHELEQNGLSDFGRIFLDGGCRKMTEIAQSPDGQWCDNDQPLSIRTVRMVENQRYREKVLAYGKAAIIAPPGMGGPGGIGPWWRRYIMPNPEAAIIFTGYIAPGTDGDKIITAARERDAGGSIPHLAFTVQNYDDPPYTETLPLRCKVLQVRASGHNPQMEITKWFKTYNPEVAILNHGSPAALANVEQSLQGDIKHIVRSDLEPTVEIDV